MFSDERPIVNEIKAAFETVVQQSLVEYQFDVTADSTSNMRAKICTVIHQGIDTLSDRRQGKGIRREVS